MKPAFWSLLVGCSLVFCFLPAHAEEAPEAPKKEKVTKMDGTSFFGIVTLTDDYTLKISNDSGIMKIPLALLGEKDFKKFALQKDRSQDGRLWSERQDALEEQKEGDQQKSASSGDSAIEIQLAEISVFQPVISVYEATLAGKQKDQKAGADQGEETKASATDSPVRLFSGPGMPSVPFSGMGGSLAQPVISAGSSAVQSAAGTVPSLPGVPGAP
jgi:hypothetical protein